MLIYRREEVRKRTAKITAIAMFTAIALTIFIVEARIPPLVPIPGIKLGLANIVTLFALMTLGRKEAFLILILRIVLGSIFAGSFMSCLYSLAGGLACFALMALVRDIFKKNLVWCVSIIGALGHNIGQILAAIILTNTVQVAWYLPVLILSGVITGTMTGLIVRQTLLHGNGMIYRLAGGIK